MDAELTTIDVDELKTLVSDLNNTEYEVSEAMTRLEEHKNDVNAAFVEMNELLTKIERLGLSISDARQTADKNISDVAEGY